MRTNIDRLVKESSFVVYFLHFVRNVCMIMCP